MSKKEFSLDDLDMVSKSEKPFRFAFLDDNGKETGIYFSVIGSQSEKVVSETARLVNERRKEQAIRAMNQAARGKKAPEYDLVEDDVAFGQRLAAVRLVGWEGIKNEFSPENALKLCQINRNAAAQITEQSDTLGNFT